jgi:hypothetical protein
VGLERAAAFAAAQLSLSISCVWHPVLHLGRSCPARRSGAEKKHESAMHAPTSRTGRYPELELPKPVEGSARGFGVTVNSAAAIGGLVWNAQGPGGVGPPPPLCAGNSVLGIRMTCRMKHARTPRLLPETRWRRRPSQGSPIRRTRTRGRPRECRRIPSLESSPKYQPDPKWAPLRVQHPLMPDHALSHSKLHRTPCWP